MGQIYTQQQWPKLLHHQEETDDYDWELALKLGDYKQKDFEACCSIFQDFAPKADPEELNRWVRFFAPPAADYIDYIKKEDRSYLYEDILLMDTDFFPESLVIFYHDFSPESKQWQKLTAQVEDFASVTWEELLEEYPPLF